MGAGNFKNLYFMRLTFFVAIFFLLTSATIAQRYAPFPQTDARWMDHGFVCDNGMQWGVVNSYQQNADTILMH